MLTKQLKLCGVLLLAVFAFFLVSCGGSSEPEMVTETTVVPTEGMITTLQEVKEGEFKISDEQVAPTPADSRVIANYLDATSDTFTVQEIQVLAAAPVAADSTSRRRPYSGLLRAASYGLMGYMMGRSMSTHRPSAGAYTDPKTYNRVSNGAGSRVQSTANRTVSRRPSGKSGYGGNRSTRSYGG